MTYSVVARCPHSGVFGVGVVTRNLAVGAQVPYLRAGVGAVASQAETSFEFGHRALQLLADGVPVPDVVAQLVAADDGRDVRQVGVVGVSGAGAAFTGARCVSYASHFVDEGVSIQANFIRGDAVPAAMANAWSAASGEPFEDRLMATLSAGDTAGGDLRGKQSAALRIVAAERCQPWEEVLVDLRVDDHAEPLEELQRLLVLSKGYRATDEAATLTSNDVDAAQEKWRYAAEVFADLPDAAFWHGVFLASIGQTDDTRGFLAKAFEQNPDFREALVRLREAGVLDETTLPDLI